MTSESELHALQDMLITSNVVYTPIQLQQFDKIYRKCPIQGKTTGMPRSSSVSHYHGDITELAVDAIVNPANTQGLGCFVLEHKCLDNIIHRRAGPRLRQRCREILKGRHLKTGQVMITGAYHLPAKYVFHVPGPVYNSQLSWSMQQEELQRCYVNIMKAAQHAGCKTVAIPCISTGLFGFPVDPSAEVAVRTIASCHGDIKVIFVTYDEENHRAYQHFFTEK